MVTKLALENITHFIHKHDISLLYVDREYTNIETQNVHGAY